MIFSFPLFDSLAADKPRVYNCNAKRFARIGANNVANTSKADAAHRIVSVSIASFRETVQRCGGFRIIGEDSHARFKKFERIEVSALQALHQHKTKERNGRELMNLSIEMKLAAAVGTTFVLLIMSSIAHAQDQGGSGTTNEYALTEKSIPAEESPQGFHGSSPDRITEKATVTYSDGQTSIAGSEEKKKSFKSAKHRAQAAQLDHSHDD